MRLLTLLLLAALSSINACAAPPAPAAPQELAIVQQWAGDFPMGDIDQLPAGQQQNATGYFGDPDAFATAWVAFKPGEPVPEVDFSSQLVVFVRNVDFYNRTNIFKVTLVDGTAEVLAMETMSAMPIEAQAAMAMAVVPRAGIRQIKTSQTETIPVD